MSDERVARCHGERFPPVQVTVERDARGTYFRVQRRWTVTVNVAHVDAAQRQLVLLADHFRYGPERYSRFLCGEGRCGWFVTALPAGSCVCTVDAARAVLEPSSATNEAPVAAASFA